jgi:DNA polymerase III delta prime subunit
MNFGREAHEETLMNDILETHDHSKLEQCQEQENIRPKRSLPEILCPQTVSDLTLRRPIIDRLRKMIETKSVMNMVFYGTVGTGKTSATRLFADCGEVTVFGRGFSQWDGSLVKNVDFVRTDLKRNLSSIGYKIVVLDGADLVPKAAQQALPSVMDDEMYHCRFLFAVNHLAKLIPEIRSRLMPICFDIKPSDREEVQKRLIDRYEGKLAEHGIEHDKRRLIEIVDTSYLDLRSIAQKVDFEFA